MAPCRNQPKQIKPKLLGGKGPEFLAPEGEGGSALATTRSGRGAAGGDTMFRGALVSGDAVMPD